MDLKHFFNDIPDRLTKEEKEEWNETVRKEFVSSMGMEINWIDYAIKGIPATATDEQKILDEEYKQVLEHIKQAEVISEEEKAKRVIAEENLKSFKGISKREGFIKHFENLAISFENIANQVRKENEKYNTQFKADKESQLYTDVHFEELKTKHSEVLELLKAEYNKAVKENKEELTKEVKEFYKLDGKMLDNDSILLLKSGIVFNAGELGEMLDSYRANPTMIRTITSHASEKKLKSTKIDIYTNYIKADGKKELDLYDTFTRYIKGVASAYENAINIDGAIGKGFESSVSNYEKQLSELPIRPIIL